MTLRDEELTINLHDPSFHLAILAHLSLKLKGGVVLVWQWSIIHCPSIFVVCPHFQRSVLLKNIFLIPEPKRVLLLNRP